MRVKQLLALANECCTQVDADKVLETMLHEISSCRPLRELHVLNQEAWLEHPNKPFLRFELVLQYTDSYAMAIKPEIRSGGLCIALRLDCFLDGNGLASKNWKNALGDEDEYLEVTDEQTFNELAAQAKKKAIEMHAQLIESVGVPARAALQAAKNAWPVTRRTSKS